MISYSRLKLSDLYTLTLRQNSLKTIPFTAAHTHMAYICESPPPLDLHTGHDEPLVLFNPGTWIQDFLKNI